MASKPWHPISRLVTLEQGLDKDQAALECLDTLAEGIMKKFLSYQTMQFSQRKELNLCCNFVMHKLGKHIAPDDLKSACVFPRIKIVVKTLCKRAIREK